MSSVAESLGEWTRVIRRVFKRRAKGNDTQLRYFFKFVIVFMCNLSDLIVYNRVVIEVVNSYTKLSKSLIKGT